MARRLFFAIISLIFLSFVTFLADEIAPGDQATVQAGEKASPQAVARLREQLGLNRPWPIRYGEFLGGLARLDFGTSYYGTKEPVRDIIARDLPMTTKVAMLAISLAAIIGIILGTMAAVHRDRPPDWIALVLSTLGVTVPTFVLAPVFVIIFALKLDVLPGQWTPDRVAPDIVYLIMPIVVLAARPMAQITRLTRAVMIETLQTEYVKLAIAKGVPRIRLYLQHALRSSLLPILTSIGVNFGFLLTGSFIIERAFLLPGMGREAIEAIQRGDTPLIQATVLIAGALFVLINLLVDLVAPIVDPRIREAQV